MIRILMLVSLVAGIVATNAAAIVPPDNVYEVAVSGMTCKGCAKEVKGLVEKLENVQSVEIDLKAEKATITMKGSATLDRATVEKALKGSKFAVVSFVEKKAPESKPKN